MDVGKGVGSLLPAGGANVAWMLFHKLGGLKLPQGFVCYFNKVVFMKRCQRKIGKGVLINMHGSFFN